MRTAKVLSGSHEPHFHTSSWRITVIQRKIGRNTYTGEQAEIRKPVAHTDAAHSYFIVIHPISGVTLTDEIHVIGEYAGATLGTGWGRTVIGATRRLNAAGGHSFIYDADAGVVFRPSCADYSLHIGGVTTRHGGPKPYEHVEPPRTK